MHTHLETGERLTYRKCGAEAWCIDTTTEGLKVGCSNCDVVIKGIRQIGAILHAKGSVSDAR